MRIPRVFVPAVIALTLLARSAPARADFVVLLDNLDQPPMTASANPFVGQSFIAGTGDHVLASAQMQLDLTNLPSSGIVLEVEARNPDGTVGATLFSDFSSSIDSTTGLITFTANSSFNLVSGTGYWLVLSGPTVGGVTWNFTQSNVYKSDFGYGLPSFNTSWISDQNNGGGNSTYFQPSDGPQLFRLRTIPEPSSFLLMSIAVVTLGFARCHPRLRGQIVGRLIR